MQKTVISHNDMPLPRDEEKAPKLDITQRIERKLAQYNASQSIWKQWLFEILSWLLSALCMGAIIGILVYLRNQPLDKWPMGLTIVTVLSKVAAAALILPISEAIGQLKWAWFATSKEIFDFEIFDKASRGAWGSMMLLLRTRGQSLAALGALLTLLLLGIDTFFQQVTSLPERWTLYGNGSIAKVIRYDPSGRYLYRNGAEILDADLNLAKLTRAFFYENGTQPVSHANGTQAEIPISCPTSKCEWEPYESLGVCSACTEMPNLLTYGCFTTRLDWLLNLKGADAEYTYPNGTACGYFLNATSEMPILMSGYRVISNDSTTTPGETLLLRTMPLVTNPYRTTLFGGSINYKNVFFPLVDALIVSAADGTAASVYNKQPPVVHECMLSMCVKKIKSSYYLAGYKEEVVETYLNTTEQPFPWKTVNLTETIDYTFKENISIFTSTTERATAGFGISNVTFSNMVYLLDELFPSFLTVADQAAQPYIRIKFWINTAVITRWNPLSPWLSPNNVTHHIERLATAMTNVIRTDSMEKEFHPGKAYAQETYVSVKWEWLTFPLTLLLLSLIFLIATISRTSSAKSRNPGVWKTSAMPTLIYGLPKDTQKNFASPEMWATSVSKHPGTKVRVKLLPNKGWRVSGKVYTPTTPNFRNTQVPPGWV